MSLSATANVNFHTVAAPILRYIWDTNVTIVLFERKKKKNATMKIKVKRIAIVTEFIICTFHYLNTSNLTTHEKISIGF